jgi:hypothetical protein
MWTMINYDSFKSLDIQKFVIINYFFIEFIWI